jgi:hypothetical protein
MGSLNKEALMDLLMTGDYEYWAVVRVIGPWDAIVIREWEASTEDEERVVGIVTQESLAAWLGGEGPAALLEQVEDEYQREAIRTLAAVDWSSADYPYDADYDAGTVDLIVQQMVLGSVVYG